MICVIFFFLSLPQAHGVQLEHPDAPGQLGGGLRPEHGQSRLSSHHQCLPRWPTQHSARSAGGQGAGDGETQTRTLTSRSPQTRRGADVDSSESRVAEEPQAVMPELHLTGGCREKGTGGEKGRAENHTERRCVRPEDLERVRGARSPRGDGPGPATGPPPAAGGRGPGSGGERASGGNAQWTSPPGAPASHILLARARRLCCTRAAHGPGDLLTI